MRFVRLLLIISVSWLLTVKLARLLSARSPQQLASEKITTSRHTASNARYVNSSRASPNRASSNLCRYRQAPGKKIHRAATCGARTRDLP